MCQVKMKKIKPTKKKDAYKVENEPNLKKLKQHFLLELFEKFKLKLKLAQKLLEYFGFAYHGRHDPVVVHLSYLVDKILPTLVGEGVKN